MSCRRPAPALSRPGRGPTQHVGAGDEHKKRNSRVAGVLVWNAVCVAQGVPDLVSPSPRSHRSKSCFFSRRSARSSMRQMRFATTAASWMVSAGATRLDRTQRYCHGSEKSRPSCSTVWSKKLRACAKREAGWQGTKCCQPDPGRSCRPKKRRQDPVRSHDHLKPRPLGARALVERVQEREACAQLLQGDTGIQHVLKRAQVATSLWRHLTVVLAQAPAPSGLY